MTIVHWPDAFAVPDPDVPLAAPQVPPVIDEVAPSEFTMLVVTVSPAAGVVRPAPPPVSFNTVTVNVCDPPTSFACDCGEIEILASTIVQVNEAGALAFWVAVWSTASTWNVWGPVPRPEKMPPEEHGANDE